MYSHTYQKEYIYIKNILFLFFRFLNGVETDGVRVQRALCIFEKFIHIIPFLIGFYSYS